MKYLITLVALLGTVSLNAASLSATLTAAGGVTPQSHVTAPVSIQSLTIQNTDTNVANAVVSLFNNNTAFQVWTNAGYSTILRYVTNEVVSYNNIFGVAELWTNASVLKWLTNTVAATTNNAYTKAITFTVPTGTTVTYTPVSPLRLTLGLSTTNTAATNLLMNAEYLLSP